MNGVQKGKEQMYQIIKEVRRWKEYLENLNVRDCRKTDNGLSEGGWGGRD